MSVSRTNSLDEKPTREEQVRDTLLKLLRLIARRIAEILDRLPT
jgi:hypothetical protein